MPLGLALGMAFAGGVAVSVFPLLLVVVPALWVYVLCRTQKPLWLAPLVLVTAACAIGTCGALYGGAMAAAGGLSALAIYYFQTKKLGNAYTVLAASALPLLCFYGAVCVPGILSGEGAYASMQSLMDQFIGSMRQTVADMALPEETTKLFSEYFQLLSQSVSAAVVPCLSAAAGIMGLANTLFFRLFARKEAFDICPLRPFSQWAIPSNMTFGIFLLLIGGLVLEWMEWEFADALNNTVNVIVGIPLILQGLSVVDFMILRTGKKIRRRRIVIYLVCGLFFSFAQMPLLLLGSSDQLFHIRRRVMEGPPKMPQF